jgi:large subunit ribosomal protein L4
MELKVLNTKGKATGDAITLPADIFAIEPNDHAVYLDVKRILASRHLGLHKAKEKNEIKASTRKIKRQKGTGTARAGSLKSGVFRGGARMFGPRVRSYSIDLNTKVKDLAKKSALTYKAKAEAIQVVDGFNFEAPKTKEYSAALTSLKVDGVKTLVVLGEDNRNVYLSSRNLSNTKVMVASDVNTYDIMNAKSVVFEASAIEKLQEVFNK